MECSCSGNSSSKTATVQGQSYKFSSRHTDYRFRKRLLERIVSVETKKIRSDVENQLPHDVSDINDTSCIDNNIECDSVDANTDRQNSFFHNNEHDMRLSEHSGRGVISSVIADVTANNTLFAHELDDTSIEEISIASDTSLLSFSNTPKKDISHYHDNTATRCLQYYDKKEECNVEPNTNNNFSLNMSNGESLLLHDENSNSIISPSQTTAQKGAPDHVPLCGVNCFADNSSSVRQVVHSVTGFISKPTTTSNKDTTHLLCDSFESKFPPQQTVPEDFTSVTADVNADNTSFAHELDNTSTEEISIASDTSLLSFSNTPKKDIPNHHDESGADLMMDPFVCATSSPIPSSDESESENDSDLNWNCSTRIAFLDHDDERAEDEENIDDPPAGPNPPQPDPGPHPDPHGGGDNDGDPDDSSDGNSSSSDSDGEDFEDGPTFRFNHRSLSNILRFTRFTYVKEMLFMELALSIANNWTYKALLQQMKVLNMSLNSKYFPEHTKSLWRRLLYTGNCMKSYAFCNLCGRDMGPRDQLPPVVHCICGFQAPRRKVKWFLSVSIRKQLEFILSLPGMGEHMQYRHNRQKLNPNNFEDIFDGEIFREMEANDGFFSSQWNFGYVFFLDGFAEGKNARLEGWPILLRLVDLPPNMRQRYMLLAGFWINSGYPNMKTFLKPFVKQANNLSSVGINWRPNGNEINSKFAPLCMCVDYKARPPILAQMQYNSNYGCFVCDNEGIYDHGSMRYPALPHPLVPPGVLRTNENVRRDMTEAKRTGRVVRGFYSKSQLLHLRHFRICTGNAIDNLHAIFERVVPAHTEYLIRQGRMPIVEKERRINQRLLTFKPPNCIARTPYDFKKRGSYKANEWRNWVFHYSIPCLGDLGIPNRYLHHWQMLCYSVYLLSQDSVAPGEIDIAENLLNRYVQLYEEYFGLGAMTPCVHLMSHLTVIVRAWGPLHGYTTFNFESYNQKLLAKIQSPKDAVKQVVTRHLLQLCVVAACNHEQPHISEEIRLELLSILSKPRRQNVRLV